MHAFTIELDQLVFCCAVSESYVVVSQILAEVIVKIWRRMDLKESSVVVQNLR